MRWVLVFVLLLIPSIARADDEKTPAYELSWGVDAPALILTTSLAAGFVVRNETVRQTCVPNCDRANVNWFDRWTAGRYDKHWDVFSNIFEGVAIGLGPVVLVADQGLKAGLVDALVVLEAVGGATATQVLASYAVVRPRPSDYGTEVPLEKRMEPSNTRSFFSGHVSSSVSSTVAGSVTYFRLGRPKMAYLLLGIGGASSVMVGVSRMMAGAHFPSDCLIGAGVGAAFGILLPAAHAVPMKLVGSAPGSDLGGMSVVGSF